MSLESKEPSCLFLPIKVQAQWQGLTWRGPQGKGTEVGPIPLVLDHCYTVLPSRQSLPSCSSPLSLSSCLSFYLSFKTIFIYLAAPGILDMAWGTQFPDLGLNPGPLHREHRILATRPSGKSLFFVCSSHHIWHDTTPLLTKSPPDEPLTMGSYHSFLIDIQAHPRIHLAEHSLQVTFSIQFKSKDRRWKKQIWVHIVYKVIIHYVLKIEVKFLLLVLFFIVS